VNSIEGKDPESELPLHVFTVEGMNTEFSIRIHHLNRPDALELAGNCFRQLEELEAEMSRYRHDSEVSRINVLKEGESLLLADVTYRCLQRSVEATVATAGLFDVTLGSRTSPGDEAAPPEGKLALSPDRPQVVCEKEGRQVDLGGIGKGFALDEMAGKLLDLGVNSALLSCGASTHLAVGNQKWPFDLQGDGEPMRIEISGRALSASGTGIQGAHVVHPDTGGSPEYAFVRVWVVAPSAALADAYSTACLLMDEEEIQGFAGAQRENGVRVYVEPIGEEEGVREVREMR
jgi:thiamine biosynthesis lipoprotein